MVEKWYAKYGCDYEAGRHCKGHERFSANGIFSVYYRRLACSGKRYTGLQAVFEGCIGCDLINDPSDITGLH
jgi:hypothetical protein